MRSITQHIIHHTDPIYVIPLFFTSGPTTRIAISLLLHPVLLEAGEALSRGTKSDAVAEDLRSGELTSFEEAARKIVQDSHTDFVFKAFMAFFRRFMLLNMGNMQATMFAVVAASIEEASMLWRVYCRTRRGRLNHLSTHL